MLSDADIHYIEATLASLRVWILELAAALLDALALRRRPIGRRLARLIRVRLREAEYKAKCVLFLSAIARLPPRTVQARHVPGFGYAFKRRKCSEVRRYTHGLFHARHVDIRARIERLRDMLVDSEAWIARVTAHLLRWRDGMHRILAAPPVARAYAAALPALSPADSS